MAKRILVTGSREFDDYETVDNAIWAYIFEQGTFVANARFDWVTIIHGACPTGADRLAQQVAANNGLWVEQHRADWDQHGKKAGPLRNQRMVDLGADVCLAFFKRDAGNRGTADCVRRAETAGIPVRRFER